MNLLAVNVSWMHWEWDAAIVEFFNKLTDLKFFELLFKGISYLGTEYVVIVLFGVTYWIFDKKMAKDIGLTVFVAMLFNGLLKGIVNRPRPFQQFDDKIKVRDTSILNEQEFEAGKKTFFNKYNNTYVYRANSTSFPSGHSQNTSALFNSFALELNDKKKNTWLFVIANVLTLLVMISRLALGVHFFTDVLVGYTLGLLVVYGMRVLKKYVKNDNYIYLSLIGIFGLITFLCPIWTNESKDMFTVYGSTVGIYLGMLFEEKYVKFETTKCWYKGLIRLVLGIALVIGLKIGVKEIYSHFLIEGTYIFNVCDMIRYLLMTFVACGLYPLLIKKWKFLND